MTRIVWSIISFVIKKMFTIEFLVEYHIYIALILKRVISDNPICTFSLHRHFKLTSLPLLSITSWYFIIIWNLCRCLLIFFELRYYLVVIELRYYFRSESEIMDAYIWRVVSVDRCITIKLGRATVFSIICLIGQSQISSIRNSALIFKSILCSN